MRVAVVIPGKAGCEPEASARQQDHETDVLLVSSNLLDVVRNLGRHDQLRILLPAGAGFCMASAVSSIARRLARPNAPDLLLLSALATHQTDASKALRDAQLPLPAGLAVRPGYTLPDLESPSSGASIYPVELALTGARAGASVEFFGFPLLAAPPAPTFDEIFGLAIAAKRAFGYAPFAWLDRLVRASCPGAPLDVQVSEARRLHAALNGDTGTLRRLAGDVDGERDRTSFHDIGAAIEEAAEVVKAGSKPDNADEIVSWGNPLECVICRPAWREGALRRGEEALSRLKAGRIHDTCIVVGNGPSLALSNLEFLDRADVFISNYAYRHPRLGGSAKYLTVVNPLVAEQDCERINLYRGPAHKIFPYWLGYCLREEAGAIFVRAVGGEPRFSADPQSGFCWSSTVSLFNLELAYWLGYRRALLIGFDHSYVQPRGAMEGDVILQEDDDPNHFDVGYFRGKRWHAADLVNMEIALSAARGAWEADGRAILNCTAGGLLDVFPRSTLEAELLPAPPKPSAPGWDSLRLGEVVDDGRYGHVAIIADGVRLEDRAWRRLMIKVQRYDESTYLEFRPRDCVPSCFSRTPEGMPSDEWGPYLRLDVSGPNAGQAIQRQVELLDPSDRASIEKVVHMVPEWVTILAASNAGAVLSSYSKRLRQIAEPA